MKFRKKPVVIEAITFNELKLVGMAAYQRRVDGGFVGVVALTSEGVPWSFDYAGHPISHENDECYLIPTLEGIMKMTPNDMLITGVNGEIYPCKKDIFEKTYEPVVDTVVT